MLLISHRGNIDGKKNEYENRPSYILDALERGYDVEVDVWYIAGAPFLGHDKPEYETGIQFLSLPGLWCHCKNIEALAQLIKNNVHCFFHKSDDVVLTSRGYMWVLPGKRLVKESICVLPEVGFDGIIEECAGICSDIVGTYGD
jgi:hypothetical protein